MAQKRTIDIDINTNADQAAKEFDDLGKATDRAAKSADNLDATFEEVYGELQPLTTRMGEAEDRLYELALAGDTASKEYQELLTKVGEYRKVQIETDLAVDGAATTMSQKLGSALTGVTSGFAATQGAMALFGSENQALEKSLLKVQAALAIQQGVDGLRTSYKELGGATGIATKAQAALNFVMNLNPFLLIATAIAAAIAALVSFTDFLDPAIDKLKQFSDFIGLTNFEEEKLAEERKKRHEARLKQEEEYRNSLVETAEQERRNADTARKANISLENLLEKQGKGQEARARKRKRLNKELTEAIFNFNSTMADQIRMELIDLDKEEAQIIKDRLARYKDYSRQIEDLENELMQDGLKKELELNRDRFRRQREDITATGKQRLELIKLFNQLELQQEKEIRDKFDVFKLESFDGEIELLKVKAATEVSIDKEKNEQIAKNAAEARERQKALDAKAREDAKKLAQYKVDVATQSLTAINDIAELFSKGSEKQAKRAFNIQKAVGIAQATINTAQAITKVFAETTDFTPTQSLRIANAVAIGVAGAAQVASIASQTFEGGGGGETPSVSASGGEAQAPSFNVVGDSGINQLAQLQQAPVQAFVVSGEVTTSQALDRNRVENATL